MSGPGPCPSCTCTPWRGFNCRTCWPLQHQNTPKPWQVCRFSKNQLRPWYVAREVLIDAPNTHFEQLRDPETGACARFETEADAMAAIKKAST